MIADTYAQFFSQLSLQEESADAFLARLPTLREGAQPHAAESQAHAQALDFEPSSPSTEAGDWDDVQIPTEEHTDSLAGTGLTQRRVTKASTWFDEDAQPPDTVRESGTTAGAHQRTEAHTGAQEKSEDTDLAGPSVLSLPGAFEQGDEAAHTHMITTQLLHALQNDVAGHLGLSEADGCTEGSQQGITTHESVGVGGVAQQASPADVPASQDDVQTFRLDPDFDYDNVKLTLREWPPAQVLPSKYTPSA